MLQNGVAADTQNTVNGTEDSAASHVDVTSAVESPASLPGVPVSLLSMLDFVKSIATRMDEIINISEDVCAKSCHQDTVENLPSADLTNDGSSDDDTSLVTPEISDRFNKLLETIVGITKTLNSNSDTVNTVTKAFISVGDAMESLHNDDNTQLMNAVKSLLSLLQTSDNDQVTAAYQVSFYESIHF